MHFNDIKLRDLGWQNELFRGTEVSFRRTEEIYNRFCQVVIPHEDPCLPGGLVYYFWSISCLRSSASCLVFLSQ